MLGNNDNKDIAMYARKRTAALYSIDHSMLIMAECLLSLGLFDDNQISTAALSKNSIEDTYDYTM